MGRPYVVLGGVTAGWGTIPVLVGLVDLPSPLIVAIRLWTAAVCLGVVLAAGEWRARRGDRHDGRDAGEAGDGRHQRDGRVGRVGPWRGPRLVPVPRYQRDAREGRERPGRPPRLLSVQPLRCALSAVVLGAHWLALFAAYKRAPAGTVILIVYLAPIGVAALAPRLLGERLGRGTIVALAAAVAGFGLLAGPTVHSAGATGLALSLVAAILFVVLIMLSKPLAEVYGGLRLAFLELAGAGLVLVPVALASTWPPVEAAWLWVVVLGVVHTAVGISLYLRVLAEVPATHVGILSYLEPVVVVLAAWLWLGQRPALVTVVGGLFVIAAGVAIAISAGPGAGRRSAVMAVVGSVSADAAVPSP